MRTDRRGFLRILGGSFALALAPRASAAAPPGAVEVHRATRNTLRGGIGTLLSQLGSQPAGPKSYPGAERIALTRAKGEPAQSFAACVRGFGAPSAFAEAPLTLAELGRLLELTNGVTGRVGGTLLRAAPSAGALYAGEVYVLAERVTDLAPGVYFYDVPEHALLRIRPGRSGEELARSVEQPRALASAAAVVLLTNVFARYRSRYGMRGYRYALVDSGHIGENLRLAAAAAGLAECCVLRFQDDRIATLLGVDGRDEAVCALHAVGRPRGAADEPAPAARSLVEKRFAGGTLADGDVAERYHDATRLVERGDAAEALAPAPEPQPDSAAPAVLLPRPPPPATTVDAAIRARRSAVGFVREPIELESLAFVLESACGNRWLRRAAGVELYVAAHRVAGIAPGLYRYAADAHRLIPLRSGDLSDSMVNACLRQEMAGSAAAGLVMVGSVAREAARAGERSYRDLLLEAGAIGQRVYLAAEALGLAARNLAAFIDDWFNDLIELDGEERAALHLTMLGREDSRAA
jgi:SagB-type dehydrogenase family enzyme